MEIHGHNDRGQTFHVEIAGGDRILPVGWEWPLMRLLAGLIPGLREDRLLAEGNEPPDWLLHERTRFTIRPAYVVKEHGHRGAINAGHRLFVDVEPQVIPRHSDLRWCVIADSDGGTSWYRPTFALHEWQKLAAWLDEQPDYRDLPIDVHRGCREWRCGHRAA